jgi:lipopolysaccharide assembly outer membrane protein LptD (OstA)
VIFTFNQVTVSAAEIVYDPANRAVTASGNVSWQDGGKSGTGQKIKIKLDGPDPSLVSSAK